MSRLDDDYPARNDAEGGAEGVRRRIHTIQMVVGNYNQLDGNICQLQPPEDGFSCAFFDTAALRKFSEDITVVNY